MRDPKNIGKSIIITIEIWWKVPKNPEIETGDISLMNKVIRDEDIPIPIPWIILPIARQ